jgi:hypothetical protein
MTKGEERLRSQGEGGTIGMIKRGYLGRGNSCRLAPRSGREPRLRGANGHGPPGRDGRRTEG